MDTLTDVAIHGVSAHGIHLGTIRHSIHGMTIHGTTHIIMVGDGIIVGMILGSMAVGHGGGEVIIPGTTTILGTMDGMGA